MSHSGEARFDSQMQQAQVEVPLHPHWQEIFRKYDLDNDGRISLTELRAMILSESYENDIPEHTVRMIMQKADEDQSGYLDMREFEKMMASREFRSLMGHMLSAYVHSVVVPRKSSEYEAVDDVPIYEEEYSCRPPTFFMVIISLTEIIIYLCDVYTAEDGNAGVATHLFTYDPQKRIEIWRFISYMFVHNGVLHVVGNLLVQILLGIPLEMVHKWWRVLLIYFAGGLAGSLGTSITDPKTKLVGASGGVYALISAHIASIIMNWSEMRFAPLQLVVMFIWIGCDITIAVYKRYVPEASDSVGYVAHLAGALAGLLVGINVLRNLRVKKWENIVWWIAIKFIQFKNCFIERNARLRKLALKKQNRFIL
ncbi:Rhomboid-like protein, partial [Gryllus bimaculatus]